MPLPLAAYMAVSAPAQQFAGVQVAVDERRCCRQSDADRDLHVGAGQDQGGGERGDEPGGDLCGWFDALLDQDGELIAAEPRDGVAWAQTAAKPSGELDE